MLKRSLVIFAVTLSTIIGLQATVTQDKVAPTEQGSEAAATVLENEDKKEIAPGALVCNEKEDDCTKEEVSATNLLGCENEEEGTNSPVFACGDDNDQLTEEVAEKTPEKLSLLEDEQEQLKFLACKDCR